MNIGSNCHRFNTFADNNTWKFGKKIPVFGQDTTDYNATSGGNVNDDATIYRVVRQNDNSYSSVNKCTSTYTKKSRNDKFIMGADSNGLCTIKNYSS